MAAYSLIHFDPKSGVLGTVRSKALSLRTDLEHCLKQVIYNHLTWVRDSNDHNVDDLIERELEANTHRSSAAESARPSGAERSQALLSGLVRASEAEDRLDEEALRDELVGFLFAGHETTAMALTFTLCLLSDHPEIRRQLRTELRDLPADPSPDTLAEISLLDRVVSESLRLYPPSHSVAREATADVTLCGYSIPAGSSIHIPQWVVHRDERWYDDPETFDPGRWTEERASSRPEFAFFPFGGGSRRCIGERFARLELRIVLATMLSRWRVDIHDSDPSLEAGLTLRPTDSVRATVQEEGPRRE